MANSIDWGKVYCSMFDNSAWGDDPSYTTVAISDVSAPVCWGATGLVPPFSADLTTVLADSTLFTADATLKP